MLTGILAVISGRLTDKYGPRFFTIAAGVLLGAGFMLMSRVSAIWQTYLIWGLLIGAGLGCSGNSTVSSIARWFVKKRGLAVSVTIAGFNFGAVIGPIIIQWLISSYGWQKAFFITGLVPIIVNIPLALLLKRDPHQMGIKAYGEDGEGEVKKQSDTAAQELSFASIFKSRVFWTFGLLQFAFGFCMQIIVVHIAPHANDMGIPALIAASILSISAAGRVVGNLTTGFLSERLGGRRVLTGCLALMTLSLVWLIFAGNTAGFFIFAMMFGAASGGVNPLLMLVPAELFGLRNLGIISGALQLFGTTGGALGSPLAGYIFDISGKYQTAFGISVLIGITAITLSVMLQRHKIQPPYSANEKQ